MDIRPTADRARESLFNILGRECLEDALVLDLFAGTGALGLEALSRGARTAVFVDHSPLALDLIHKNIMNTGSSEQAHVVRHDLSKGLFFWRRLGRTVVGEGGQAPQFDLIFLDPPYRQGHCATLLTGLLAEGLVGKLTRLVFEDDSREHLPEAVGALRLYDQRAYGDTGFWLYRMEGEGGQARGQH